jgi:hypothetical protein
MKTIKGCSRQNVQDSKTSVALLEAVKLDFLSDAPAAN